MTEENTTPAPEAAPAAPEAAPAAVEAPKLGVQETKDVLVAVNELALFVAQRAKDGLGVDDAMALVQKVMGDEEFKLVMMKAAIAVKNLPAELKDLDIAEGVELAQLQLTYLPKLVQALKK